MPRRALLAAVAVALLALAAFAIRIILPRHDATRYPAQRVTPPGKARILVVGCGLPRTGTESTREALRLLGFGDDSPESDVHHMYVAFERDTLPEWSRIVRTRNASDPVARRERAASIRALLAGFRAVVDYPVSLLYQDFLEDPDVKFVLTLRDTPEAWFESVRETVGIQNAYTAWRGPGWDEYGWYRMVGLWIASRVLPGAKHGLEFHVATMEMGLAFLGAPRDEAVRLYDAWSAEVRRVVPKHRLLEFNVKDGWDPLVEFLGVPRPDAPFPAGNDRGALVRTFYILATAGYAAVALAVLAGWGAVSLLASLARGGSGGESGFKVKRV